MPRADQVVEQVQARVREEFGIPLLTSTPVLHGIDDAARLWRSVADDGAVYAVKLTSGGTAAGLVLPARLAARAVSGVAAPVPTLDGRLWAVHDGSRLSLVPWVSDQRAPGAMTRAHWYALGEVLATAHATPVTDELEAVVPRERYDHSRAVRVVRDLTVRLDRVGGDDIAVGLATEWDLHRDRVAALLALAEDLGRVLSADRAPDVVCHADPHLGNVLLAPPDRVWLVDWDDAVLSPRERDLMFPLGGMGDLGPTSDDERDAFFEGYGDVEVDPVRLTYFRAVRALEDLDLALPVLDHDRTRGERADAVDLVLHTFGPDGLVTAALGDDPAQAG